MGSLRGETSANGKGRAAIEARLEEITAEKQRIAAKLASVEEDREMLQSQLQDVRIFSLFSKVIALAVVCVKAGLQRR